MTIEVKLMTAPGTWVYLYLRDGETTPFEVKSDYLVSAGQSMTVHVSARVVQDQDLGERLIDARELVKINVNWVGYFDYIPSDRTLYEILEDAIGHYALNPTHGVGCSCLDRYVQELKQQILRVVSKEEPESNSLSAIRTLLSRLIGWL